MTRYGSLPDSLADNTPVSTIVGVFRALFLLCVALGFVFLAAGVMDPFDALFVILAGILLLLLGDSVNWLAHKGTN
jgi:hypothetical protein